MKTLFSILTLIIAIQLHAQQVCRANQYIFQAEVLYRQKTDLKKAVDLYEKGFEINATDGSKILDALNGSAQLCDTFSSIKFLKKCYAVGITTRSLHKLWPRMSNGMNLDNLLTKIDTNTIINNYKSALDTAIINQLKLLAINDQKYRGNDETDWEKQKELDRSNWHTLKNIIKKKGRLPHFKEIGIDGQEDLELLFIHMDKKILEWFMPYVLKSIKEDNSNLSEIVLYQLDRIGMDDGLIYTINSEGKVLILGNRTRMKNGYYCQSFGEWFYERSSVTQKLYETPIDPTISISEVNRVRQLFCLDSIENKRSRWPWIEKISIEEFEILISE